MTKVPTITEKNLCKFTKKKKGRVQNARRNYVNHLSIGILLQTVSSMKILNNLK
uniref:Uncharacterized protein n=1 Tax=Rhizophora mucronata TaxID=61149 RepID=A0A2P2PYW7_RHIMU